MQDQFFAEFWQEASVSCPMGFSLSDPRERVRKNAVLLVSKVVNDHSCFYSVIRSRSLSLAHTQREGNWLHLLKGRVSKNLWIYVKTTTMIIELLRGLNVIIACESFSTCLVAQTVKNVRVIQGTWVQSLGWKDLLEKRMLTHSSTAWKIPWTEEPGGL